MTIDPRAAAAAAQAAAEAAAAAASAAAASAAAAAARAAAAAATGATAAEATNSTAPTLANSTTREVLGDTGVTLGTELSGDAAALAEIGQEGSALGDQDRSGFMELPGLDSSLDRAGAGPLAGAASMLDLTMTDSSPVMGKGMISDDALTAAVGSTDFYRKPGTSDAGTTGDQDAGPTGGWVGDVGGKGFLGVQGTKTRYRYDDETGEVTEESTEAGTSGEDTSTSAKTTANADQIEGGAVKDTGGEPWYSKVWNAIFGDDDDAGADAGADGGTDGGTTDADAGGGSDVPAEDAPFNPPPGWIGPDGLGLGVGGAVVGSKGGAPGGGENLQFGPSGGNTVINYGSEGGPITGEGGPLRDLTAANWVGQPVPDADAAPLDPAKLSGMSVLPGPEVINPGSGEQADASTEASTAYRAPEGDAPAMPPGASGQDQGLEQSLGNDDQASQEDLLQSPVGSLDDPMADPLAAIASDGDDGPGGRDGAGRDFGQGHGKGHEHDDRGKDEDDLGD